MKTLIVNMRSSRNIYGMRRNIRMLRFSTVDNALELERKREGG
jgi:hypothetical protein